MAWLVGHQPVVVGGNFVWGLMQWRETEALAMARKRFQKVERCSKKIQRT